MITTNTSNVAPIRASERNYTIRLSGTVTEFQAAYITHEQALYWDTKPREALFDHVMRTRENDDPADGTPAYAILPERYDVPGMFDGVVMGGCNLTVEDANGRIVYDVDLSDEDVKWQHTRSQFHYNPYNLVGKENSGRLVVGHQYYDCLTYRFMSTKRFSPSRLTVGWSFYPSEWYYSSVCYNGVALEAETGSGMYTLQAVDLYYRNAGGKMWSKRHSVDGEGWLEAA